MSMRPKKKTHDIGERVLRKKEGLRWTEENGMVVLKVEHRGFYAWVAQRWFHKPRWSTIRLDATGSYVWKQVDGQRNLYAIAAAVQSRFGEQVEPLYPRFWAFVHLLWRSGLVETCNQTGK